MYALEIVDVQHYFGSYRVLYNINLQIAAGQIVAIVGPSGCGKTTLLRAILGTDPPKEGKVIAAGREVRSPSREVGIVYQNYVLYDFLTAEDNVAFGLTLDGMSLWHRVLRLPTFLRKRREHRQRAREFLDRVNLNAAHGRYPSQLSGGMKQRVAIAQAFILEPKIVLLDEPFGALDENTRESLQMMLLKFYQENLKAKEENREPPYTIIIVTHELNEALYVADRVIGLSRFHTDSEKGSTVVYDRPSPVFRPEDPRDFSKFIEQREELRRAVFDPVYIKHHSKYVSFWNEIAAARASADSNFPANDE